uniref:BTB domain-containing protein n=1 Tax=Leersia perrieri TaxID=77586 RepID=A0A0D9W6T5_9ORYZ
MGGGRVRFNVGGQVFETTTTTLANAGRESMLGALLDSSWNLASPAAAGGGGGGGSVAEYFIDRNPACFAVLLDLLRTGSLHRRPVSLGHSQVNDVAYLDESTLLVAARERRLGKCDDDGGGMAAFSAASGDLRHRFRVAHARQPKSFTAGALAFDRDASIFASCKGRLNEYGIGVWDRATGEQSDFFYEPPGCALGDADKLQWLDATNALMVATLFPKTDNCFIGLLDFRDKSVAWSWSDAGMAAASLDDKRVLHAIAMEDERSVCVINQYDDLGFLDLRSNAGGVRWSSRSKFMNRKFPTEESCYPKLATHGGQLFSSMNDSISVFSGPECVLTSTLRRSHGGAICDFSIGGDRLFALHNEENVFDVWETPPPPII